MTRPPRREDGSDAPAPAAAWNVADCHYFAAGTCRSCTHLAVPYATQVVTKQHAAQRVLADHVAATAWLPPVTSAVSGFRNKVKLAVGGTLDAPALGLNSPGTPALDLRECPIQERAIWQVVPDLAGFITYAGLVPYDVDQRVGELKFVIVTTNTAGELLVRFVVRTNDGVERVRRALPALVDRLPQIVTVSANLHPEHKAVLEGDVEISLTDRRSIEMSVGDVRLHLQHRSFFQTNTAVAGELYRQAAAWADEMGARTVLDLYCGVGGFALHLAAPGRRVHGVEIEASAIASARRSAAELGIDATFDVGDAATLALPESGPTTADDDGSRAQAQSMRPQHGAGAGATGIDLVVINPPRRGIEGLAEALNTGDVGAVIYSSCNPASLAADLSRMPRLRVAAARLFDMFPHTDHAEIAVLLKS